MSCVNQDQCVIVDIGTAEYYVRGKSWPRPINHMAGEANFNACTDAGISIKQIDGIAYYSGAGLGYLDKFDTASLMETLGMDNVSFSASLTSGGGGWRDIRKPRLSNVPKSCRAVPTFSWTRPHWMRPMAAAIPKLDDASPR